ncbi:MAG: hypothetical protein ABSH12_03730 [Endomicrobiales bacterium]
MIKKMLNWQIILSFILILLSGIFYFTNYEIFHDSRSIVNAILDNVGFAFFEVFLVTIVINGLLLTREKKALLRKLNMVIGTFFIEVGTDLMQICSKFDPHVREVAEKLASIKNLSNREFDAVYKDLRKYNSTLDYGLGDIECLKGLMVAKRGFLLSLLENPNLLEHDSFTNLLWATFHLADELSRRKDLKSLLETDRQHISKDISRVYSTIISEWIAHMKHLKIDYPYLFSLAIRTNPFDTNASVELK